jgi:protein-S-isoprenylcysteine O-methyltransferase Ste14
MKQRAWIVAAIVLAAIVVLFVVSVAASPQAAFGTLVVMVVCVWGTFYTAIRNEEKKRARRK